MKARQALFGRYTVAQRDRPGSNFRIAPSAGVEAPTGDDDEMDALAVLPPGAQVVSLYRKGTV